MTTPPPAQTHVKQCAQCGKEHKKCLSGGCPKCAPGLIVAESEFRKPIAKQTPPRLTDEQVSDIGAQSRSVEGQNMLPYTFARAIETAVRRQFGVNDE